MAGQCYSEMADTIRRFKNVAPLTV